MKKSLVFLCLSVCLLAPALSQSDPKAVEWIDKLAKTYQKTPLSLDVVMDMAMEQAGQQMKVQLNATSTYKDDTHSRMAADMNMETPMGPMSMKILTVGDGETIWTEVESPMGPMISKMSYAKAEEMSGGGMAGATGTFDVSTMVKTIHEKASLNYNGVENGVVRLSGVLNPELAQSMGAPPNTLPDTLVMEINEANTHPVVIQLQKDGVSVVTATIKNVRHLKSADLDDAMFTYEPKPGVPVTDLDKGNPFQQ